MSFLMVGFLLFHHQNSNHIATAVSFWYFVYVYKVSGIQVFPLKLKERIMEHKAMAICQRRVRY